MVRDGLRQENVTGETAEVARAVYILHIYAPVYDTIMHVYAMCRVSRGSGGWGCRRQASVDRRGCRSGVDGSAVSLVCGLVYSQRQRHIVHARHTVSIVKRKPKVRKSP
jgi:hypothetical protein